MSKRKFSGKAIIISCSIIIVIIAGYFIWQHYKYKLVNRTVKNAVTSSTDSLYRISYDSMHFDEVAGNAYLQNIRIIPDTSRIKSMPSEEWPAVLLDVHIKSITIKGVQTAKALEGKEIVGDTVIINQPRITMYTLKPLKKNTKIEFEAKNVYEEILGNLKRIHMRYVLIDSINVESVSFKEKNKNFDFINGNIQLNDVLIDSAHNEDTARTLFCRNAAFTVDSFRSYNNNRPEFIVKKVAFSGAAKTIVFEKILLNRFNDAKSEGKILLDANSLKFAGLNTDEIVKRKNLIVDTIECGEIKVYEPPKENLNAIGQAVSKNSNNDDDSASGFRNVYSINLQYLGFKNVNFIPLEKNKFDIGKIKLNIKNVSAARIGDVEDNPLEYIAQADLDIERLKLSSKDRQYNFIFNDIEINSLRKTIYIGSVLSRPVLGERDFANHYKYQKDRFDVSLKGITLSGIEMENIFNNKLIASDLVVKSTSAKIYRDLNKPLEEKSKVGKYPSQLLTKLDFPVSIAKAHLPDAFIQYRERQVVSKETGTVSFNHTDLKVSNITNIKNEIAKNNVLNISFVTSVLKAIPLQGNFKFFIGNENGDFEVIGQTGSFNALAFNSVSVPMALVKIKSGKIDGIKFDFKGDNTKAGGNFVMKYENLKIDVLKKDEEGDTIKKRGLVSLFANIVVKNNNPQNGELRKETPEYDRNIYKSFFNLVWKTVFTGIKGTVGIP